jgi:hypothetical protein
VAAMLAASCSLKKTIWVIIPSLLLTNEQWSEDTPGPSSRSTPDRCRKVDGGRILLH